MILPIDPLWAIPISDIPNPRKLNATWVSDVANILSAEIEFRLNQRISQLESRNGSELAVVTVPDTIPLPSPKAYATELFNTWGIGKRGIDNGVLLLISVKERRIEIETGRGITSQISNEQVAQIIETKIKPEFKLQKFDQGTINGVEEIASRLEQVRLPNFDFAPIYNGIGIFGVAIALGGIAWMVLKINSWCQLLPSAYNFQSPLVFQIKIQKLKQFANAPMRLIAFGVGAIAISASALLWQDSATGWVLQLDRHFLALLTINAAIALISIPMWFGITYYWLAKLTKALSTNIPHPIWKLFGTTIFKNLWLLLSIQCSLLFVVAILISPSITSWIPTHLLFIAISLICAMSYQFFLIYVVNNVSVDDKIALDQYFCVTCRTTTQRLDEALFDTYLSKPEQLAVKLGNATYSLYCCDLCHPATTRDRQHIYCHPNILKEESVCAKCHYPTVIAADLKQSRKPKKFPKQGSKNAISIMQCQNCFHEQPVYPYVPQTVSSSYYSGSSTDYSSSSSSYDSYDYGSSSSSSSDFGGGSSDGGGSGSDW